MRQNITTFGYSNSFSSSLQFSLDCMLNFYVVFVFFFGLVALVSCSSVVMQCQVPGAASDT